MNAKTIEEVNSINPDSYLLSLWRDYYFWKIDNIPGNDVILEKDGEKQLLSKVEAKSLLSAVTSYTELLQYKVYKVQYVEIALVLPRDRITGGFLKPGDAVMFFAKNGTRGSYREIVNHGYVELVLLPTNAGRFQSVNPRARAVRAVRQPQPLTTKTMRQHTTPVTSSIQTAPRFPTHTLTPRAPLRAPLPAIPTT
jgi:hypothetical protein